jgi:hypothetical protein
MASELKSAADTIPNRQAKRLLKIGKVGFPARLKLLLTEQKNEHAAIMMVSKCTEYCIESSGADRLVFSTLRQACAPGTYI